MPNPYEPPETIAKEESSASVDESARPSLIVKLVVGTILFFLFVFFSLGTYLALNPDAITSGNIAQRLNPSPPPKYGIAAAWALLSAIVLAALVALIRDTMRALQLRLDARGRTRGGRRQSNL